MLPGVPLLEMRHSVLRFALFQADKAHELVRRLVLARVLVRLQMLHGFLGLRGGGGEVALPRREPAGKQRDIGQLTAAERVRFNPIRLFHH